VAKRGLTFAFYSLSIRFCYREHKLSIPRENRPPQRVLLFFIRGVGNAGMELFASPMVCRAVSLLLGLGLFHVGT
jgi:hypothetical protein